MKMKNRYGKIKTGIVGQTTLEFAIIIPLIIIIVLAASQIGLMVYSKMVVQQASREAARILSTTNDNSLAAEAARSICGSDFEMRIEPREASQRHIGEMVSVRISRSPGGMMDIIENITGKEILLTTLSGARMECGQYTGK